MKRLIVVSWAIVLSVLSLAGENRVAVVISHSSYNIRPAEVDPAAKSWTAACNLSQACRIRHYSWRISTIP